MAGAGIHYSMAARVNPGSSRLETFGSPIGFMTGTLTPEAAKPSQVESSRFRMGR